MIFGSDRRCINLQGDIVLVSLEGKDAQALFKETARIFNLGSGLRSCIRRPIKLINILDDGNGSGRVRSLALVRNIHSHRHCSQLKSTDKIYMSIFSPSFYTQAIQKPILSLSSILEISNNLPKPLPNHRNRNPHPHQSSQTLKSTLITIHTPTPSHPPRLPHTQTQRPSPQERRIRNPKDLCPILERVKPELMLLGERLPRVDDFLRFGPFLETEDRAGGGPAVATRGGLIAGFGDAVCLFAEGGRLPGHVVPVC